MPLRTDPVGSPLVAGAQAFHVLDLPTRRVSDGYRRYGIDVSGSFAGLQRISMYQCEASTYRFFHPYSVAGDGRFYARLQALEWYYMPWKWEHDVALGFLEPSHRLLEVGSGDGGFLRGVTSRLALRRAVGLELNAGALTENGSFRIVGEPVQSHRTENRDAYDIVCSFQVLEHIADVHSFLEAKIGCLRVGGMLLLAVPNNASYIRNLDSVLNMPPHHMGLWDESSLRFLVNVFPLRLVEIFKEPLQDYHIGSYLQATRYRRYGSLLGRVVRRVDRVSGRYQRLRDDVQVQKDQITGQTIFAAFEKVR